MTSERQREPSDPKRRRLLRGLGAAALAWGWGRSGPIPASTPQEILRRIPSSGEALPAIGLGTAWAFDVGGAEGERAPLREILELFAQRPGRLIDTSPMYGAAEGVIGDLCTELGVCPGLFVATKVWTEGREQGVRQMEQSMQRLRRRRLDLIQVHNLVDWGTHLGTLRAWKEQGRVRYLGITHYRTDAYDDLERVMRREPLDFVQLNYSIATREAERRLLPLAAEKGIAVIVNRPFDKAAVFRRVRGTEPPAWAAEFDCKSWGQFFLKYILGNGSVTCAIPSTGKPRHLVDNLAAGYGRLPDEPTRRRMVQIFEAL